MIIKSALPTPVGSAVSYVNSLGGYALFKCECGNEFFLRESNSFTSWDSIRCSECRRKARIQDHVGERYVMKRVKSDAVRAGREFTLTLEWFINNLHAECHYCGRKDTNNITVKSKVPGEVLIKDFKYNGIDRVDNNVGYIEGNVVPCCFVCNRAKQSMTYHEFKAWITDMVYFNL